MYQDSNFLKDNFYHFSNSFDDILEYIIKVFNNIETDLLPLDDEIIRLEYELQNHRKTFIDDCRNILERPSGENRNNFGFPKDLTFNSREKEEVRSSSVIEKELYNARNAYAIELEKIRKDLLILFENETPQLIEKIISFDNPRQLLGLINRVFQCLEEHYFGASDSCSGDLLLTDNYYCKEEVVISSQQILNNSLANYISVTAKKGGSTVGAMLIENAGNEFEIKGVGVAYDYRREGIGSYLVSEAVKYAKRFDASLSVVVPEDSLSAQLFFKENDFVALKTCRNYFAGMLGGYFMIRRPT